MMKSKNKLLVACALMTTVFLGGCQKKEVSVEKLKKQIIDSVTVEQKDSGRVLTVDTIFLNKTSGNNYVGELHGSLNDTIKAVFDLKVTDEGGDEVDAEWNRRQ